MASFDAMPVFSILRRCRRQVRAYPLLYRALIRARSAGREWGLQLCRFILPASLNFGPAKGWFSMAEKVRTGARRGRILFEGQRAPDPSSSSLRRLAPLGQHLQQRWPVFWSHHADARLIGPTLLLEEGPHRVGVESAYGPDFIKHDPGYRQFRRPPAVRLEGNWTSVISRWSEGFCHWFVDALPRLALLQELPPDTRIIVPANLQGFRRDTLEWLGLMGRVRPTVEQHLSIENYYFCSPTNVTGLFDPYAVEFLRRSFLERRDTTYDSPQRFFVHRVGAVRGLVNEEEVLKMFHDRGWAVIDTERLTMAQQIQLFARAEHVCALHGAALTNLLWCKPRCRVIELVASTYMNGTYEGIAEGVGLDYDFLVCAGDIDWKARVNIAKLKALLPK